MGRRSGIIFGIIGLLVAAFFIYAAYRVLAADRAHRRSVAAYERQDYPQALQHAIRAVKLNPRAEHWHHLAYAQKKLKRYDEAIHSCNRALARSKREGIDLAGQGSIYGTRGDARASAGRYPDAIKDFEKCAELQSHPGAYNNLAWMYATVPDPAIADGKKAVEHALIACQQDGWMESAFIDTLAAAHARNGHFAEAMKYQEQAISMTDDPEALEEYRRHLACYRKNQPFTEQYE
ncbi:MAG: tetratricopeptide repeat protein [Armatimonadota bacterium]